MIYLQLATERVVLCQALGAVADAPGRGPAVAAVAADVAAFASAASKDEGKWAVVGSGVETEVVACDHGAGLCCGQQHACMLMHDYLAGS
jgi:hypothetical protein